MLTSAPDTFQPMVYANAILFASLAKSSIKLLGGFIANSARFNSSSCKTSKDTFSCSPTAARLPFSSKVMLNEDPSLGGTNSLIWSAIRCISTLPRIRSICLLRVGALFFQATNASSSKPGVPLRVWNPLANEASGNALINDCINWLTILGSTFERFR